MNRGSPLLSTDFLIKETLLMSVFDGSISLSCSPSSPFSSPPVSIWVSILTKILTEKKVKTRNFFQKKAFFARENAASPALAHNIEHIL
jgi:hypothetical protein